MTFDTGSFHSTLIKQIEKESLGYFLEQLNTKQNCLLTAQIHYASSLQLVEKIQTILGKKAKILSDIQEEIKKAIYSKELIYFHKKKDALVQWINSSQDKLNVYLNKLELLAGNIRTLGLEIAQLNKQNLEFYLIPTD